MWTRFWLMDSGPIGRLGCERDLVSLRLCRGCVSAVGGLLRALPVDCGRRYRGFSPGCVTSVLPKTCSGFLLSSRIFWSPFRNEENGSFLLFLCLLGNLERRASVFERAEPRLTSRCEIYEAPRQLKTGIPLSRFRNTKRHCT